MSATRPSMQELIRRRRRAGLVGRGTERAAFRTNFDVPPDDERHRFLFHVHGNAGVGKTFLVRELEQVARENGALTAYVDESAGSVPEAMSAISGQFAGQGRRCKELDRMLATHRERRHEAQAALPDPTGADPEGGPSAGGLAVARAGLLGLGMVPGVGALAPVLDADRLAQGADRLRAGLGARLRNHDDAQLVLSPERVLTPVLLNELSDAASAAPWIVLFFDTYERTGPLLDAWLHDVMTGDRYGALPATVVVVTAGRSPFDTARWGAFTDFMTDMPLEPFTEVETRSLLAGRGVVAEPVVEEVLRLTGGLPVLVSTLAESRPAGPDDVGDPSATAVERFLRWEHDPVRKAAALACALPRWLDGDVLRSVVDGADDRLDELYEWLRNMPFVTERGDRMQYHDVVRAPMLRLQRGRFPRAWAERQRRLADVFRGWREETEAGRGPDELWQDENWRELRLAESYHSLCTDRSGALTAVLRDLVRACAAGDAVAGRWARLLTDAGQDAGREPVARWADSLTRSLTEGGTAALLSLLLRRAGLEAPVRALAHAVRGSRLRHNGAYAEALAEYDRALALDPGLARAYRSRAMTHGSLDDYDAALADIDRALALNPDDARSHAIRGDFLRTVKRYDDALRALDEAIRLDPATDFAWGSRGALRLGRGDPHGALADLNQALELTPDYPWALARRARVWRALGEPARQRADLDRALAVHPDSAWILCERGDALRVRGHDTEALADYDRALALDPEYASAYASRGVSLAGLGRHDEALADLDRALELSPEYEWARRQRESLSVRR
ncbi:tetratricopeptide repeat protein [Streptomyces sp. NPDC056405]|uniref:tetratricopeptide repeat protein n=1 Tax=Streptomyces sp. NPDC056405 TaxID=3345811 RepID=UPI0035D8F563